MLKNDRQVGISLQSAKPEPRSSRPKAVFGCGMNRRAFLRRTGAAALLLGLIGAKPSILTAQAAETDAQDTELTEFNRHSQRVIEAVQMQLFPADGDGPSAKELHAFEYLIWALDDPDNQEDGDKGFILRGVTWLEEESTSMLGDSFLSLDPEQQDGLLRQIANTRAGENWLSLLLYYLLESLTLDPIYGGNPEGIGWRWLEHQPGFPRPPEGKTYLDFS